MKKFYETPAVEFTGFNAEDVITTSIINTADFATGEIDTFNARVNGAKNTAAVPFSGTGSYQW